MAPIVASRRGRAKPGLQASNLFSRLTRRLNLGRELVLLVVVEELIDVEVVNGAVVVKIHMIITKIEGVGIIEDPVLSEVMIWLRGARSAKIALEVVLMNMFIVKSCETADVVAGVELIQGRCSCD